jgi:hypothetical protein
MFILENVSTNADWFTYGSYTGLDIISKIRPVAITGIVDNINPDKALLLNNFAREKGMACSEVTEAVF